MAIYTQPSIVGYNDNPPSNDGTESIINNGLDWDRHLNDIGDPLDAYIDAVNTETDASFDRVAGMYMVSVKDPVYGAVGDGVTDDTAAIQAAITAGPNKTIFFPEGKYLVTSTLTVTKQSMFFVGVGGLNSEILFNPTAADICFYVHNNSAVYYRGGFKGLFFNSDDTTYAKTAIQLEDTSEYSLEGLSCHGDSFNTGWSDSGFDSVFLHTKGRDSLSTKNLHLSADLGILIDQNPNTSRLSTLDADHYHFNNTFITTTSGADTPCIRIADGVNLADVSFTGYNPWVRPGGHGFEWIDTTSNAIASLNLVFDGVGFEQAAGSTSTDYGFYISKTGTNNLQNLNIRNFSTPTEINGIYLRNVKRASFQQGAVINTFSGAVVLDVDSTCDDISSDNCTWPGNTGDSVATTTGLKMMTGLKKDAAASPLPENFHFIVPADNPGELHTEQGVRNYNTEDWSYFATVADDDDFYIPSTPFVARLSFITIVAYSTTGSSVTEWCTFISTPSGITQMDGSTNTGTTVSDGDISLSRGSYDIVTNKLGESVDILVRVTLGRAAELI